MSEKGGKDRNRHGLTSPKEDDILTDFIEALDQKQPGGASMFLDQSLRVHASTEESQRDRVQSEEEGKLTEEDCLSGMVVCIRTIQRAPIFA